MWQSVFEVARPLSDCNAWNSYAQEDIAPAASPTSLSTGTVADADRSDRSGSHSANQHAAAEPRSRSRRRRGLRLGRARRRRARHRQVDAAAPGRAQAGGRRAGALRLRRRVAAPDRASRPPPRHHELEHPPLQRDIGRAHRGRDREDAARRGDRRLDSDRAHVDQRVDARLRRAGPRFRRRADGRREAALDPVLSHRPHHEGRNDRRAEVARAHRRHGPLLRRREVSELPRRARVQESLRSRERGRDLRDARRRTRRKSRILRPRCSRSEAALRDRRCSPRSKGRGRC